MSVKDFTPAIVCDLPVINPVTPIPASGKLKVWDEPVDTILNFIPAVPIARVWAVLSRLFIEIMPVVASPEIQFKPESVELSAVRK